MDRALRATGRLSRNIHKEIMNDGSDCGRAALSAAQIDIRSEWVAQRLSAVISAKLAHPSFYSVILRQRSRSRSEHFQ